MKVLSEPKGVSIYDPRTGELLDRRRWVVLLPDGTKAVLHLRVARGTLTVEAA